MRSPYQMQKFNEDDTSGTNIEDYTQLIVDLLSFGQTLCKKKHGIGKRLSKEVMRATQGKARLLLPCQDSSAGRDIPFPVSVSFPVPPTQRILHLLPFLYLSPSSWLTHAGRSCIPSNCQPSSKDNANDLIARSAGI